MADANALRQKVLTIPYFPMVAETNFRQGLLTDEQYTKLRDALPEYLRPSSSRPTSPASGSANCSRSNGGAQGRTRRRYNNGRCRTNLAAVRFSRAACAMD